MGARRSGKASGPNAPAGPADGSGRETVLAPTVTVRVESAATPDSVQLIRDSQAALLSYLPAEEIFSLDPEEMLAPNVTFFVARIDGRPMGCVALVDETGYGEIKRLFLRPEARGRGLAQALMAEVEQYCRDIGLREIRAETSPLLVEAAGLYQRLGYRPCDAFGDYPVLDSSLFLSKSLGRAV